MISSSQLPRDTDLEVVLQTEAQLATWGEMIYKSHPHGCISREVARDYGQNLRGACPQCDKAYGYQLGAQAGAADYNLKNVNPSIRKPTK